MKAWRRRLCTSDDAGEVLGGLRSFYDDRPRRWPHERGRHATGRPPASAGTSSTICCSPPCRIPILVLGDDDRVLYANLAAETFFSLSHGMLKRQTLPDIIAFSSPLGALVGTGAAKPGATVNEYGVEVDLPRSGVHRLVDVFAGAHRPSSPA